MDVLETAQAILKQEPWVPTPLLRANSLSWQLGADLWLKREDCTPIGSFKLRGALVTMTQRAISIGRKGIYLASAGNYGLAIATAAQRYDVRVTVVVPEDATPSKIEKIRLCGATIIHHGVDFDAAKNFARTAATVDGGEFLEDGVVEEMAYGASTIASEILDHSDSWDMIVIPIGNGSLIRGIGEVFKTRYPGTTIVGLVPAGAPAMAKGIAGRTWDENSAVDTYADGLAVRMPILKMVESLKPLIDDVWVIDEEALLPAVKSLITLEQVMVEPSASITIAGLASHRSDIEGKKIAAIITGSHLRPSLMSAVIDSVGLF